MKQKYIGNLDILDVKIPGTGQNTDITGITIIEIFVQYPPILLADTDAKNPQNQTVKVIIDIEISAERIF